MAIDIKSDDGTSVSPWIHIKLSAQGAAQTEGEKCPLNHAHPQVLQALQFEDISAILGVFPASYLGWLLDVHANRHDDFKLPSAQERLEAQDP